MRLQIRSSQAVGVLAVAILVAVLLSSTFLLWRLRLRELEHARLETVSLTEMFMEQTQQYLQGADIVLQGVQERLASSYGSKIPLDSEMTHLLLATRVAGMRQLRSLSLVDAQGQVVNSSESMQAMDRAVDDEPYFQALASGKSSTYVMDKPHRNHDDGRWTVHMARALRNDDGSFRGVVVAALDIARFEALFYQVKLDFVRPMAIYQEDGTLMASFPHRGNDLGGPAVELTGEQLPARGQAVRSMVHTSGDGARQLFALGRLNDFPLLLSVTDEEDQSLAAWREIAVPIALSVAALCLFTVFMAFVLTQKLRRKELLEAALNNVSERYLHTVDSVKDAIVAVDEGLTIQLFNPAAQAMFGLSSEAAIGQPLSLLLPERARSRHDAQVRDFSQTREVPRAMAEQLEICGRRSDGSEFPIESSISKTEIDGKLQMTAVLRDVTQQRRAQRELAALNQELRDLYASQQTVREQERSRISRELHDDLGQQLTGLKLSLAWIAGRGHSALSSKEAVDEMRKTLDGAIMSVRRISSELRPLILDELGFADAVAWQTREFCKHSGLQVVMNLPAQDLVQGDELATALFRIVQESLTNVVRHAQARAVWLDLVAQDGFLVLTVRDDGCGMGAERGSDGIGLISMRERARMVGGSLELVSSAGAGTSVQVRIALETLAAPPQGAALAQEGAV